MVEPLGAEDPRQVSVYSLRGRLGSGGMGTVYLSSTPGGHPVALKVIRREFADDPTFRRRFAREVAAAQRVQSPYTVAVVDSDTVGNPLWLASSHVPGPTLAGAVREHGPLPLTSVLMLAAGIAEALQSIHAVGITHRDLKPSNVLLGADGPRVIDFGIARAADSTALTGTDVRLGTPAYMSPEQAEGEPEGPAVDVFALGLVMFYAATERHPFGEGSGPALLYRIVSHTPDLTDCPAPLRPLVERCLSKDPAQRPEPAAVVAECRNIAASSGADLSRGEGWWLPELLAAQTTEPAPTPPEAPAQVAALPDASPGIPDTIPKTPDPSPTAVDQNPPGTSPGDLASAATAHATWAARPATPPPFAAPPYAPSPVGVPGGPEVPGGPLGGRRARLVAWSVGGVAVCAVLAVLAVQTLTGGLGAPKHSGSSASSGAAGSNGNVGKGATIRIGTIQWDESVAVSTLWKAVLERRGYRVEDPVSEPAPAFAGLATHNLDFFPDAWLPSTHEQYLKQYGANLTDLGAWSGDLPLHIAVPSYVKGVKSMADLKGKSKTFDGRIIGIEPSAGEMQLLTQKVLPGYGLDDEYEVVSGSTASMLSQLRLDVNRHKPVAVVLWEPHWAQSTYQLTELTDPKGLWGTPDSLHTVASEKFLAARPRVAAWLRGFHMSVQRLDSLLKAVNDSGADDPMKGVRQWITQHPHIVDEMAPVDSQ